MTGTIIALVILIILSGFFSGGETAVVSLSDAKVRSITKSKTRKALLLKKIKSDPHRLLITILIGNNLVNIGASVLATALFVDLFGSAGLGIATGVMTFFVLVFGEITPKSFATKYPVKISLFFAYPIYILQKIFSPVIWLLDKLVKFLIKSTGGPTESKVSEDEIKALIDMGAEGGSIEKREKELLQNILRFNDIEVEEVMTPRVAIDALSDESTLQEAIDFVIKKPHTRIPVFKENLDNIVGIVTTKDILALSEKFNTNKKLGNLKLMKPILVPVSKKIDVLFKEFQKARQHLAIAIDEYGGTAGIVTLEDLLEEIVGEIADETDIEGFPIEKISERELFAQGTTRLEEINNTLGITIKGDEKDPISALILDKLRRFPKEGEVINFSNITVTVEKMFKNMIVKVRIRSKQM